VNVRQLIDHLRRMPPNDEVVVSITPADAKCGNDDVHAEVLNTLNLGGRCYLEVGRVDQLSRQARRQRAL